MKEISNQIEVNKTQDQNSADKAINSHSLETGRSKNFPDKQQSTTQGNVCFGVQRKNDISIHSDKEYMNVYVINSSNKPAEYLKWTKVVDLCLNDFTTGKLPDQVAKADCIVSLITESDVEDSTLKKIQSAFIDTPPCFVNENKKTTTDAYGISSKEYVTFIIDVFKAFKAQEIAAAQSESLGGTNTKRDAIISKISKLLGDILEKWHTGFKNYFEHEVEYVSIDRLGRRSNITNKTFKQAIRYQLAIFWATLFECLKHEDNSHHCNPIKWTFERISPKNKSTIDIKIAPGLPSKVELAQLLSIKTTKRENDEVRLVMAEKIIKISVEETSKITDDGKKSEYSDLILPGLQKYVTKFLNCRK